MSSASDSLEVAVFGPGLLGGSLALAIRKRLPKSRIRVWARRAEAVSEVERRHLAEVATNSVDEAVAGARLIVLATPIEVMPELSRAIAGCPLEPGCVVTDVGSVKGSVVAALEPVFARTHAAFVGSHPMAGSDRAGLAAARPDLFEGAVCLVTPTEATKPEALAEVTGFWEALGCRVMQMGPGEHDRIVARISHLPHVMAAVTTLAALRRDAEAARCSGNGLRDTTRVAGGDPALWASILSANREALLASLRDAAEEMRDVLEIVEGMDEEKLRRFLDEAKVLRDQVPAGSRRHGDD